MIPNWARPTLVVRNEEILTPAEAHPVREGDYVYLLAPPEKAQALDRFFVNMPPPRAPDPRLLGDFFVPGTATLGALAEIYGLQVAADHTEVTLADYFSRAASARAAKIGDVVELGPIALLAHKVERRPRDDGRLATGGAGGADRPGRPRQGVMGSNSEISRLERAPRTVPDTRCASQAPPNSTAVQNRSPSTVLSRNGSAAA